MDSPEQELIHQDIGIFTLTFEPPAAAKAVGANQRYVTHLTIADFFNQCLAGRGMTALKAGGDLKVLSLCHFIGAEQSF
jgi:hypothetical protein